MLHTEEIQEAEVKIKVGECIFHLFLAKFVDVQWIDGTQVGYDTGEHDEKYSEEMQEENEKKDRYCLIKFVRD